MRKEALAFVLLFGFSSAMAQQTMAQVSPVYPTLLYLKSAMEYGLPEVYEVHGEVTYSAVSGTGPALLAASELRMWPGSRLVLMGPFSGIGFSQRAFLIFTPKIIVMPPAPGKEKAPPPVITWQGRTAEFPPPPTVGKGLPGRNGVGGGIPGGVGSPGTSGNPGFAGQSAPTLYLAVGQIEGGDVTVDLRGQNGGPGGDGQSGGDGGAGGVGEPGVPGILNVDCRRGPGDGGAGGGGGNGGSGGQGGRSGDGGALYLMTSIETNALVTSKIRFNGTSGQFGKGGKGGGAGIGGQPGQPGSDIGPCRGGARKGKLGPDGQRGSNGLDGEDGISGGFGIFPLNENLSNIFKNR